MPSTSARLPSHKKLCLAVQVLIAPVLNVGGIRRSAVAAWCARKEGSNVMRPSRNASGVSSPDGNVKATSSQRRGYLNQGAILPIPHHPTTLVQLTWQTIVWHRPVDRNMISEKQWLCDTLIAHTKKVDIFMRNGYPRIPSQVNIPRGTYQYLLGALQLRGICSTPHQARRPRRDLLMLTQISMAEPLDMKTKISHSTT